MKDKRITEADVVAELRDGMTIGIGGWGSRRKPMSLVRAIARSKLQGLTIVSYGGPDVGLLCAVGKVRKVVYGFVSLDSIPLEPHFRAAREKGAIEVLELDEGMFQWGLYAAALRLPFLPTRAGLGADVVRTQPSIRTVRSPYEGGEELVAVPALDLDVALVHMNRADASGERALPGPRSVLRRPLLPGGEEALRLLREDRPDRGARREQRRRSPLAPHLADDGRRRVVEAPHGAHFTTCEPDYARDEVFQREYAASAASAESWGAFKAKYIDVDNDAYRRAVTAR